MLGDMIAISPSLKMKDYIKAFYTKYILQRSQTGPNFFPAKLLGIQRLKGRELDIYL